MTGTALVVPRPELTLEGCKARHLRGTLRLIEALGPPTQGSNAIKW